MILKRFLLSFFLLLSAVSTYAVNRDSLIIRARADGWYLMHYIMPGETIAALSHRYNVSPSILAGANRLKETDDISRIDTLTIPLASYNILTQAPQSRDTARPLYYRVEVGDNIDHISRMTGVFPEMLRAWNNYGPGEPLAGKVLLVGWLHYDPTSIQSGPASVVRSGAQVTYEDSTEYVPLPVDATAKPPKYAKPSTLQELWNEQTVEGLNVVIEKGTAGFFNINGNTAGAGVYAFHNSAARGTVIMVRNLNNGRIIYVKVLGPLPETKQYAGCVLGLSNGAKAALGVRETKAFCEMTYAGY